MQYISLIAPIHILLSMNQQRLITLKASLSLFFFIQTNVRLSNSNVRKFYRICSKKKTIISKIIPIAIKNLKRIFSFHPHQKDVYSHQNEIN